MAKFNGMAVVSVSQFTGENATLDVNGKKPVVLSALAGKIPSKRILSGTIADNMGLIPGKSYVVSFTEGDRDPEFGRQFSWANGGAVAPLELLQFVTALGLGENVDVMEPVPPAGGNGGGNPKPNANEKVTENEGE